MNRLLHGESERLQAGGAAPEQSPSLVEQFGLRHIPSTRLTTGELCAQQVARVEPAVRRGAPPRRRVPLPTQPTPQDLDDAALRTLQELPAPILQILDALDACDPAGPGRAYEVAQYAAAIAAALGLGDEVSRVRRAALLSNVGLASVPQAVLSKTDALTAEERQLIRRHAICSAEILHDFESLHDLIPLVLHHHENHDGSGYPYGLSGDWIPRGARVIRVAETYVALLRSQPYRPALTAPEALTTLQTAVGAQFDPMSVAALATCLDRGAVRDEVLARWRRERLH